MANKDFTLKRHNGTGYDVLLPTTHLGQIYTDATQETPLSLYLTDTFIPLSQKGEANGVATLDSGGKIPLNQLSSYLIGGIKLIGPIGGAALDTMGEVIAALELLIPSGGTRSDLIGIAWSVTTGFQLTEGTLPANTQYTINPGDEGDTTLPIDLEAGDMMLVTGYSYDGGASKHIYNFSMINNTTSHATASAYGIVQLAPTSSGSTTIADYVALGDEVLRAYDLTNLTLGGDLKNYTTSQKIAFAGHTHSQYQPVDSDLTTIAGLSAGDGNFIVGNGTNWTVESDATARASLGLTIGTHVQAYDATLQGIAAVAPIAAGNILYTTGTDTFGITPISAFGISLIDDADAETARTTLGLTIGTNVQAYDADLKAIAALTGTSGFLKKTAANTWALDTNSYQTLDTELTAIAGLEVTDGNIIVGNGTTWVAESGSTARASLGLTIGTHVQAYNADLTALGGLAKTDGNFIVGNGTTWVAESGATARASLGVYSTTEIDTLLTNRPEIFYDTTTGAGLGDLIIDLD